MTCPDVEFRDSRLCRGVVGEEVNGHVTWVMEEEGFYHPSTSDARGPQWS